MVSHHSYIGFILLASAIAAGLGGLFITLSQSQVTGFMEHDNENNSNLKSASRNLIISYILAYAAALVCLILSIVYFLHGTLGWAETIHLVIFLLIGVAIILSVIFAFLGLSDIDTSGVEDKKSSVLYIWIGVGLLVLSIILLVISGAWRIQHLAKRETETAIENKKYVGNLDGYDFLIAETRNKLTKINALMYTGNYTEAEIEAQTLETMLNDTITKDRTLSQTYTDIDVLASLNSVKAYVGQIEEGAKVSDISWTDMYYRKALSELKQAENQLSGLQIDKTK